MLNLLRIAFISCIFTVATISAASPTPAPPTSSAAPYLKVGQTGRATTRPTTLKADRCTTTGKGALTRNIVLADGREPICCGQCNVSGTGARGCLLKIRGKEETYCSPCN
jgi:hypothetical protein